MATYILPTNAELTRIGQEKVNVLTLADPIFQHIPIRNRDSAVVKWEQQDNYVGLQAVRGINGQFSRVAKTGAKQYIMAPGYYGEYEMIDEKDMTEMRRLGTDAQTIDVTEKVLELQDKLLLREVDRIKQIAWTLMTTGTFSVSDEMGKVLHTDSYSLQTYNASTWATGATATPLADFRAVALLARGKGCAFNASARAYCNQVTANHLFSVTNADDIGGKLIVAGNSIISLADVNKVLLANDLPQIVVYDEGYLNDAGTFVPHIADNKVCVVGKRTDGAAIGEYQMTRNTNNPDFAPGSYDEVITSIEPPRTVKVFRGHNGGPAIMFPGSVVVMDVS